MIDRDWTDEDEEQLPDDPSRLDAAEMMRRYRWWENQVAEIDEPFAAEIKRLQLRRDEVTRPARQKMEWYQEALEKWHRASMADKSVKPTVKLPYGDMMLRKASPVLEVTDEAEVLAWAAGEGLDVLPDPRVMTSKLKAVAFPVEDDDEPGTQLPVVDANGEVVPGVRAEARARTFSIKKGQR